MSSLSRRSDMLTSSGSKPCSFAPPHTRRSCCAAVVPSSQACQCQRTKGEETNALPSLKQVSHCPDPMVLPEGVELHGQHNRNLRCPQQITLAHRLACANKFCLCGRGHTSSSEQQIQENTDSFDIACSRKRNCSTVHRADSPPFSETYLTSGSHIVEIARVSPSVDAWRQGCDAIEVKQPTVPRHCALYLEHLEEETWLVFIWGRQKRPFSGCSFCWKNEVKVHWLQKVRESAFMVFFCNCCFKTNENTHSGCVLAIFEGWERNTRLVFTTTIETNKGLVTNR